jgi:hypothetical protein
MGGIQVLAAIQEKTFFEMYPNPLTTAQSLTIETTSAGTLQLLSTTGQTLQHYTISKGINKLNLPMLQAGVYLLRFSGGGVTMAKRLVIY